MPCDEWCRLVEGYRNAVDSYNEAVKDLSFMPGAPFNEVWHRTERARTKSDRSRAELLHHEHDHGCLRAGQFDKQLVGVSTESLVLGDQGQSGG